MDAKLSKNRESYILSINKGTHQEVIEHSNLSLKNCQAIERGFDLDEEMCKLVDKKAEQNNQIDLNAYGQGCLNAFQKALEILGDKKFSEEDLEKAYLIGCGKQTTHPYHIKQNLESIQQTEWDGEIETESIFIGHCNCPCHSGSGIMHVMACCNPKRVESPKLDVDGCLILKRK